MPDWLPLVLTILVLLALPMLARRVQLSWRLRSGQEPKQLVASAWREVRATFEDLGLDWDDGTPTQALGVLEPQLNESAASTLTKIATTVERSQFAREGADISELITDVRTLRAQLASDETKPMRARMLLLPASLRSTPIRKS